MNLTHFLVFNSIFGLGIITFNYFVCKFFTKIDPEYLSTLEFHNGTKYFHTKQKDKYCKYVYKVDELDIENIKRIINIISFVNDKIKLKKDQIYHSIKDRAEKDFKQIHGIIIRDCFTNFIEISKNDDNNDVYLYIEF